MLDATSVTFIEIPPPNLSAEARRTAYALCELGLRAHIVAHVRCNEADVQAALDTPVFGLNLFFGTSAELRTFSHGRRIAHIPAADVSPSLRLCASSRF